MWPVKAMPASLMTPLCTGAVTIASNSPGEATVDARSSSDEHVARIRADRGDRRGTARPVARAALRPVPWRGRPGRSRAAHSCACARRGPAPSSERSASSTTRQLRRRPGSAAHRSGPMPAGSPVGRARRSGAGSACSRGIRRRPRRAAGAAQISVSSSARASRSCDQALVARHVRRGVVRAAAEQLHDVPAELRLEWLADLVDPRARRLPSRIRARTNPGPSSRGRRRASRSPCRPRRPMRWRRSPRPSARARGCWRASAARFRRPRRPLVSIRMCRACTCATSVACSAPRTSTSLKMLNPLGVRMTSVTSPFFMPGTRSRHGGRQQVRLAPADLAAFERCCAVGICDREVGEILVRAWHAPARPARAPCAPRSVRGDQLGTEIRMCATSYSFVSSGDVLSARRTAPARAARRRSRERRRAGAACPRIISRRVPRYVGNRCPAAPAPPAGR